MSLLEGCILKYTGYTTSNCINEQVTDETDYATPARDFGSDKAIHP